MGKPERIRKRLLAAAIAVVPMAATLVHAQGHPEEIDGAYLDPPYVALIHPETSKADFLTPPPPRSDVDAMLSFQTPARSQASRGTCTFFSTVGLLESELIEFQGFPKDTDLSEQWLTYVVTRNQVTDGSGSIPNFQALMASGMVNEPVMPYEGAQWTSAGESEASKKRCGGVPSRLLKSCLVSHYDPRLFNASAPWLKEHDPEFLAIREEAERFRQNSLSGAPGSRFQVRTIDEAKNLLAGGTPLTLDIDFYYGAWNHRKADEFGIKRDLDRWDKGVVGYPAGGSMDRAISPRHRAGHSVLVLGYDDGVTVVTPVLMTDGSWKTFSYRGVYYIKNSWGTQGFGRGFKIHGDSYPGFGMITQRYTHEMGAFYKLPLQAH
jgi:hypothetical protein